jgi:hypothetical protein
MATSTVVCNVCSVRQGTTSAAEALEYTPGFQRVRVARYLAQCIFIATPFRLNRRSCLLSESGNASIPTFDLFSQRTVSTFCQFVF